MNDLNALIGIDFSLIGTKLRAVYEKREKTGTPSCSPRRRRRQTMAFPLAK